MLQVAVVSVCLLLLETIKKVNLLLVAVDLESLLISSNTQTNKNQIQKTFP